MRTAPWTHLQERIGSRLIRIISAINVWVYRLTGGRLGGRLPGGVPVLLLTTIGRQSGKRRTSPLLYLRVGEDLAVVASKAGMPRHPAWYLNLEANSQVEVQIGRHRRKMVARCATKEERSTLWPELVSMYGDYEVYQARTRRQIPVVILSAELPSHRDPEHSPH